MRLAAEFLACLPAKAESLEIRPVDTDRYLLVVTLDRSLVDGRNTPEQNCLQRAVKAKERLVLAALGFGEGEIALAAGTHKGQLTVLGPDKRALEVHRFDLPPEWGELLERIDTNSPFDKSFALTLSLTLARPHSTARVRQTTADDVRALS